MTDYIIPCDTFVRLSNVLYDFHDLANDWFRTIRIDNGQAVATNRKVMAIENIGGVSGVIHVIPDAALIDICRKEAPFSSCLTITVNEALQFAVAKTTLGYVHPTNCVLWSSAHSVVDFDKWRAVVMSAKTDAKPGKGGMFWHADDIARLASASPSGRVVFARTIDAVKPTLIRDINDPEWLGAFNPFEENLSYEAATMPGWMTA